MKTIFALLTLALALHPAYAEEGMWLPMLLSQLNEKQMTDMGMKITAEDIYSINHSSLKDAVMLFGGGCTAELVSGQGLILTNHHCGYSNIQKHSSLEHDYLTDGFWAASLAEELPNPGLSVTFLIRMEEVTGAVLKGIPPELPVNLRDSLVEARSAKICADAVKGTVYKASIKPLFAGNRYFMFVTITYTDVRLVGAPPSNIGKFGGDTDNWMWPRHTGDFSVFRIYCGKDNQPAPYNKDNVPYTPKKSLEISLKGVQEGDFTFVYGFPGTTQEYLPACALDYFAAKRNPMVVKLRGERLDIINAGMNADRLTRIQYAAKAAGIANGWKKTDGETRGLKRMQAIARKEGFEQGFSAWAYNKPYGTLLPEYRKQYEAATPVLLANLSLNESILTVEAVRLAAGYQKFVTLCHNPALNDSVLQANRKQLIASARAFYANYNPTVDKQLFGRMAKAYLRECPTAWQAPGFVAMINQKAGNIDAFSQEFYTKSLFTDSTRLIPFLQHFTVRKSKVIEKDPAYQLGSALADYARSYLTPQIQAFQSTTDSLQRVFMQAQLEMQPDKRFYPDANLTLRITYGNVKGYLPADGVGYNWFTTLDGIMQKEDPEIYDYVVEPKLKELYTTHDYGPYADADGSMHVAFIATNHTTGGNSGSPVLNARGQLVGINFDRCWEGTMSDLMYDPDMCRNISLDIRYCLFIIEKFAGAKRLVDEMTLARD